MTLLDDIEREAKLFFEKARGSHDWSHIERVYKLCEIIGKKENADLRILKLAALLHDIGRLEEDESKGQICHAERSSVLARGILEKHNVDKETIERVVHCIETHRKRKNKKPESVEAKVFFDADKLDSIGAVGIGRLFLFAGEIGATLHNKKVDLEKHKTYSKDDTAFREFEAIVKKIKDMMLTNEGKRIAEERHKFMVEFFDRLNDEVDGLR
jgi:uncharacterized protein